MQQVFVTYAPETADARRVADEVKAAFEGPDTVVAVKPASQSSILDLEPVVGFDDTGCDSGEEGGLLGGIEAEHNDDSETEEHGHSRHPGTDGKWRGGKAMGVTEGLKIKAIAGVLNVRVI